MRRFIPPSTVPGWLAPYLTLTRHRSCAAAIGRTYATVVAVFPAPGSTGDTTYSASPQLLWCLAELSCVYLVFCMPMVPAAFSEKTLLGQSVALVWSWRSRLSRSSQRNATGSSYQKSWPKIFNSSQGRGRRLSDDGDQAVGLVDLGPARTATNSGAGSHSQTQAMPSGAILKTTEFGHHNDPANSMAGFQYHDVQDSFTLPTVHSTIHHT